MKHLGTLLTVATMVSCHQQEVPRIARQCEPISSCEASEFMGVAGYNYAACTVRERVSGLDRPVKVMNQDECDRATAETREIVREALREAPPRSPGMPRD